MNYVADTHTLVWYFTGDKRLSRKAFRALEETLREGLVVVPAMVLAEIMYISKKGRVLLDFGETLKKLEEYDNFEIAPLDVDILKVADSLDVDMEMHDKLIVATTLHYEAALITRDQQIKDSAIVPTIW